MRYINEDAPLVPRPRPFLVSSITVYGGDLARHQPFADSPNWDLVELSTQERSRLGPIYDKDEAPPSDFLAYIKWVWYHSMK